MLLFANTSRFLKWKFIYMMTFSVPHWDIWDVPIDTSLHTSTRVWIIYPPPLSGGKIHYPHGYSHAYVTFLDANIWHDFALTSCVSKAPHPTTFALNFTPSTPFQTLPFNSLNLNIAVTASPYSPLDEKMIKYAILIPHLWTLRWNTQPPVILTNDIHEIIHKSSVVKLSDPDIPTLFMKSLLRSISCIAIKYLTYMILNKWKHEKHQSPIPLIKKSLLPFSISITRST